MSRLPGLSLLRRASRLRPARAALVVVAACLGACATAPPDPYQVVERVPLTNPGFESDQPGPHGGPAGWSGAQHAGEASYRFTVDRGVRHRGERSLRIDNIGSEPFGALEQTVPANAFRSRSVRFSGWIKTREATGKGASLIASAEGLGVLVAHNFMTDAEVTGTQDWRRYAIVLAIPPHAGSLRVGVMMQGPGTVWFDDAELEIVAAR